MFKLLGKMISKMVGWGIRKLGGGLREIGEKLATYDLDITDDMVRPNIIQSMSEVDMIGKYDDISKYDPVPYEKIIESKDKLTRNYLTKVQVYWNYERDPVPHAEILSVTHDENISLYDIERRVSDILDDYSTQQQLGNVKIVSIERVATLHREGNAY
jgi:hypothetical protein